MFRRLFSVLLTAGLLLIATPAFAQPPATETTTERNVTETFIDVVPTCQGGGPEYEITITYNEVEHSTVFADGREHDTFTQTGTFVATPVDDPALPTYTGKFTVWGGFNANGKVVNGTFTFSVHGTGSDGSTISVHDTDHFNTTPNGAEFAFTHCHD
jgi:hypothetical protein